MKKAVLFFVALFALMKLKIVATSPVPSQLLAEVLSEPSSDECDEDMFAACLAPFDRSSFQLKQFNPMETYCKGLNEFFDCLRGKTERCAGEELKQETLEKLENGYEQLRGGLCAGKDIPELPNCVGEHAANRVKLLRCKNESKERVSNLDNLSEEDTLCIQAAEITDCMSNHVTKACGQVIGTALHPLVRLVMTDDLRYSFRKKSEYCARLIPENSESESLQENDVNEYDEEVYEDFDEEDARKKRFIF